MRQNMTADRIATALASFWLAAAPALASAASPSFPPDAPVVFSLAASSGDAARRPREKEGPRLGRAERSSRPGSRSNYWTSNSFPEDRDFKLDLDSQISRVFLLEGWRFDSNQFSLNWSHILGGAVYYQFGRTSHLSWLYSWMMSIAGSTWWEVIGEPKEVIAINDQIMTGLGGFAAGEPWYQLGQYLTHQSGLDPARPGLPQSGRQVQPLARPEGRRRRRATSSRDGTISVCSRERAAPRGRARDRRRTLTSASTPGSSGSPITDVPARSGGPSGIPISAR